MIGTVPTAVTDNSTLSPSTADNDSVNSVITGGDSTLSVTVSLVSLPAALLTVTLYSPPPVASMLVNVNVEFVASTIGAPSFDH